MTRNDSTPAPAVDCPISILLHSHFFFDSGLKIVNQEAAQHTQILADKTSKIWNWWVHRRPLRMYYAGSDGNEGPATHDGPQVIREDSEDVLMVTLWDFQDGQGYYDYTSIEETEAIPALVSLKEDIERWWAKLEKKKKIITNMRKKQRTANMHLPSGQLVDFTRDTSTTHHLFVRAAVLRDYMRHHCLYHFLDAEDPDVVWWIKTADDEQEEDIDLFVSLNDRD